MLVLAPHVRDALAEQKVFVRAVARAKGKPPDALYNANMGRNINRDLVLLSMDAPQLLSRTHCTFVTDGETVFVERRNEPNSSPTLVRSALVRARSASRAP
jgi:hypothetical protein